MTGRPRIAFIDIETAPIIAAVWSLYETNAVWVEQEDYLLSFAVMWEGAKSVKTYRLCDYPDYAKKRNCDLALCRHLWKILDEADFVVAHNGDAFDIRKIRARFIVNRLPPPSPFKTIDTLKISRKVGKFPSNKLDNLGSQLGCGRKLPNTGAHLWRSCMKGDRKAWNILGKYNAQDVVLLKKVYDRLKPWAKIDLRPFNNSHGCPVCLSPKVQRRGISVARSRQYQRYHCQSCGHWFSGERCKTI